MAEHDEMASPVTRGELREELQLVRGELREELQLVRGELREELQLVRGELREELQSFEQRMLERMEQRMDERFAAASRDNAQYIRSMEESLLARMTALLDPHRDIPARV